MKIHIPPDEAVHGGRPFEGPTDEQFRLLEEDTGGVSIGYSHIAQGWVVVDNGTGQILAEGSPAELAVWLLQYCLELMELESDPR
jgi:hypothetical protein